MRYVDPVLGPVKIVARQNSGRLSARWGSGELLVNAPSFITMRQLRESMDKMQARLLATKPKPWIYEGAVIGPPDLAIHVLRSDRLSPMGVQTRAAEGNSTLSVGRDVNLENPNAQKVIIRMLKKIASYRAEQVIPALAADVADDVSKLEHAAGRRLRDHRFVLGSGFRTLGTCYPDGRISLSYALMFMPYHLRDYVIRHELTHLTEMNHSARFHALLDYYTRGHNNVLRAELRAHRFPFPT